MYKTPEDVLNKLIKGDISISTVTRNMNKHLHKGNIKQWLLFAEAKALYRMKELGIDVNN